jgi:hypothetical protein
VTAFGQEVTKLWHTKTVHLMLQLAGNTNKLTEQMSTHSLYYSNRCHTFPSPAHAATGQLPYRHSFCCNPSGCWLSYYSPPHISVPNETHAHYFLRISNSRHSTGMFRHSNLKAGTTPVWQHISLHILQFCFQFL